MALLWGPERLLLYNDAFRIILGAGHPRGLGRSLREAWPEACSISEPAFAAVTSRGETIALENVLLPVRQPNELACFRVCCSPVSLEDGSVAGTLVVLSESADAQRRAGLEAALNVAAKKYSTMFDSTSDGVWLQNLEGEILEVNDAYCGMSGYTRTELTGMKVNMLEANQSPEEIAFHVRRVVESGGHSRYESRHRRKDGTCFDVDITALYMELEGGTIACFARDITDRKRVEEELKRSEEDYRHIVEYAPTGICEIDYAGPRFRRVNDAMCHILGYSREELLRMSPAALLDEPGRLRFQQRARRALVGEAIDESAAFRVLAKNGREIWAVLNVKITCQSGKVTGALVVAHDITARRRMEQELRKANVRLVDADRQKDVFLAVLSHELRNPLAPVRYALPILAAEPLSDRGGRALAAIDRQSDQLTRLVDDLLDVSRIASGNVELRREHAALGSIVGLAVESASPVINSARHSLEISIDEKPIWMYVDTARIAQVITNLLTNSARYTPRGGRLALQVGREDRHAVIRVQDNGSGIPPEALPTIFDMFRRVRKASGPLGGLGIGLAIVKRLVEMHDGTVEAFSNGIGQGAVFTVKLPLINEHAAIETIEITGAATTPTGGRCLKVLIVDDNADLVEMLALIVEGVGHQVHKAFDGESALSAALSYQPDVVLLDLGLPVMSGFDVARELRLHPETRDARLVALTGWGQPEDQLRTRDAGFDRHLTKPTAPGAVERLLAEFAAEPSRH